jgi:proline iminopeptidase
MKVFLTVVAILITNLNIYGQALYTKTFGNPKDKALLFLHGGPGYNAINFEYSTADILSKQGFYVIVYDRRGEGRSVDTSAKYTFQQSFEDIQVILNKLKVKNVTLLGHSFGGVIASLFTEKYPKLINKLILIGAPIIIQETFNTIITSSKVIYESKGDKNNLGYLDILDKMDKKSLEYSSYCFGHAMQNGFYLPKKMTEEAKNIYTHLKMDTVVKKYASQMSYESSKGFWLNEKYTSINLTNSINNILKMEVPVYGIYGKDDGLYSLNQIEYLEMLITTKNLKYIDNCSHNAFIDQQNQFIEAIIKWMN